MGILQLKTSSYSDQREILEFDLHDKPISDQVKLSILRDLWNLNWQINFNKEKIEVIPPENYNKEIIKQSMAFKRLEIMEKNHLWIDNHMKLARSNLADGISALKSEIIPKIEVCETKEQHNLFRILRYYWSSPYSEYVGRRIKLIIRDSALPNYPVIGITALGSPIIHVPDRDKYIGWDKTTRTKNLIYAMDAYVVGALPPYNHLLGGKLISYILASNEIRKIYKTKYSQKLTLINKRKASDLVALFTTSLYGTSSQYNRIKFGSVKIYNPIGETKGYGTLHLSEATINLMRQFLLENGIFIGNKFGDGPSWRMRIIRTVGGLLGFDSDLLLKHSFKRKIYFIPLAKNSIEFLRGEDEKPDYFDWSLNSLVEYWKERWFYKRKNNLNVINQVIKFKPESFNVI